MRINIKCIVLAAFVCSAQAAFTQTATATPATELDEFAKKKEEYKIVEVVPTDSLPATDLVKRAEAWFKLEAPTYKKTNAASSADKGECVVSFPVKPKALNPQVDYTGKVTMKVLIECKNSKYRYTISEIRHISKSGEASGGLVENEVPECGSMEMSDLVWKKLKGEMLTNAAKVVADLKIGMSTIIAEVKDEEW